MRLAYCILLASRVFHSTSIMAAVEGFRIGGEDGPWRKKPKIFELPISSAKRSSIEGLLHVFKKKGEFDSLRKKVYAQFESGVRTMRAFAR